MFLENTLNYNRKLIDTTIKLHKENNILPDSFILDLDTFIENATLIYEKANKLNIRLFYMLKQLGHNPYLGKILEDIGYDGAVSVDFNETRILMENNLKLCNVGHLVQIPDSYIHEVINYGCEYITIFSIEKLISINEEAKKINKIQKIIVRVADDNDYIYPGQTAGIYLEDLQNLANISRELSNIKLAGVTSFPCFLYDENKKDIVKTPNLDTVLRGKSILESYGFDIEMINTPSTTCERTLELIGKYGGNTGEPGHGLTATTPLHKFSKQAEKPAIVYLTEISHNFKDKAYAFGGGYYRRGHMENALVINKKLEEKLLSVEPPDVNSIDYHFSIGQELEIGSTVIMSFRYQLFVSRSDLIIIKGISNDKPEIIGVFDCQGNRKK